MPGLKDGVNYRNISFPFLLSQFIGMVERFHDIRKEAVDFLESRQKM